MMRRVLVVGPPAIAIFVTGACHTNVAGPIATPPPFQPTGAKCAVKQSENEPLIVEWPSASRGKLEASAKHGVVAVRYAGCEMTLLPQCTAPAKYGYVGFTRKRDHVSIRDTDDLYAKLPVGAVALEAKLAHSGELNVSMTIVGRYEAERSTLGRDELTGDCDGATHLVSAMTVGAFDFYAGADAQVGGGASFMGAGGGASSGAHREMLNEDGDERSCDAARPDDKAPPFGCGALIRVEVVPLGGDATKHAATSGAPRLGPACPPEMVGIPGGAYTTGETGRSATVTHFCMDRTEVTSAAYQWCVDGGGCAPAKDATTLQACNAGRADRYNHPANCVDWTQANAYCAAKHKRLPSEEEWEWAARGGDRGTTFPWGNDAVGPQACWKGNGSPTSTCQVGSYPAGANPWGVLDLSGNVHEWTATVDGGKRVFRGGGWFFYDAAGMSASVRAKHAESVYAVDIGFRCVKDP